MERITERFGNGYISIKGCRTCYSDVKRKSTPAANAIVQLAAYEDTGMTPEEITNFVKQWEDVAKLAGLCKQYGTDRLAELLQTNDDGSEKTIINI